MTVERMFVPPAFVGSRGKRRSNAASIQREGRIIRDLTMPEKDWPYYDEVAKGRYVSERAAPTEEASNVTPIMSALIRRQAT